MQLRNIILCVYYNSEDIFFSPGVVPAISFLIQALTNEGDGIIIQQPVYYPFGSKILGNRRVISSNSLLYSEGACTIDFADLEAKFADPSNKGLILCSPHNPAGRVWTLKELRQIVDIAKKHGKWIISDEILADLVRKGVTHTPLLKTAPDYVDHIAVYTAPSKTFNLAGVQLSNIIIPNKEWQKKWADIVDEKLSVSPPNPFAIVATIAAYTEGEEWLEQAMDYIDENIRYVEEFVKKHLPKAHVAKAEGTYLVWIDFTDYEADPKKLEFLMQHKARVALDEGYIFGHEGSGFERINVATPHCNIEECMKRIKETIVPA